MTTRSRKISIGLSKGLLEYVDGYRQKHGLSSCSGVLARALKMLREVALAESYRALSAEYKTCSDLLAEAIGAEELEPSNEATW